MNVDAESVDPLFAPYLEHAGRGIFALPRCRDCGEFHFYPQPACPSCGSEHIEWRPASGRATVYSYSIVHRAPDRRFADAVPYVVAIVATEEGPHLMSRIEEVEPQDVRIGMPVRARLRGIDDEGVALPTFTPEGSGP